MVNIFKLVSIHGVQSTSSNAQGIKYCISVQHLQSEKLLYTFCRKLNTFKVKAIPINWVEKVSLQPHLSV